MIQSASCDTDIMVEEHIKENIVIRCFPIKDTKKHVTNTITITTKTALMQIEYRVESKEEEEKWEGDEDSALWERLGKQADTIFPCLLIGNHAI